MENGKMEEKMSQFDELECVLRNVAMQLMSKATLPSFLVKEKPEGNAFEYLSGQMLDPDEDAGMICRDYIECAAKIEKVNNAKIEIKRLLDIAAQGTNTSSKAVKEAVIEIMEKYTPSVVSEDTQPKVSQEEIFDEKLAEIQHMRHLLDFMERNIQGKLTEQEAAEMEENGADWMTDIEKLKNMVDTLNN